MATTLTVTAVSTDNNTQTVYFTVALTGNYGTSGSNGDPLSFANLFYQGIGIQSDQVPFSVTLNETPPAGTAPSGYEFEFAPGTTQANGQLLVLQVPASGPGPLVQYSTTGAAYNSGLLAAVIAGVAVFPTFI